MKIKNTHKSILLVFACWALLQSPVKAQQIVVPPSYVFFHGDSLDGFNWPLYLNASELKRFSNADLLIYLKRVETAYVHKKYTPLVYLSAAHSSNNSHRVTAASPCNNVDFEDGNYTNWNGDVGENDNSAAALTVNIAGIVTTGTDAATTACSYQTLVTTGTDPYGGFPMLDPGGGSYAVRLGSADINENYNWAACSNGTNDPGGTSVGEQIYQSYAVTTANAMFTYNYAVVLNDGGHTAGNMPYFRVEVLDNLGNPLPCLQYYIECSHGVPPAGFLTSALKGNADPASAVYYLPWTSNTLNLKPYIGTTVTIRFTAAGCTVGGHFGYAYVDATCSQVWPTVAKTCNTDILTAPPGGTAYSWTGPGVISGASSQTATANVSGTYTVVVTTGPGCTYILDTAITVPAPIVINTTSTPAICTASNGSASVTSVTGGTPPFTFSWNSGQTTSTINNITSGSYTVTVTDVNGCPQTATVNVGNTINTLTPTISPTNDLCNGGTTGSAKVTGVAGGTPGYTYSWNNGQTSSNATALGADSYTVTVTDANGCTGTGNVTIAAPPPITTAPSSTPSNCSANDGSATITAGGGTPGYTYSWNTGQTTSTINNVGPATYTVTVKDANNCSVVANVTVASSGAVITPTIAPTNELCSGGTTGSAKVTAVTGGTPGYTYSWNNGQTGSTATALGIGTYTVTVTDNNGCTGTGTVTINQPTAITTTPSATPSNCSANNGSATITASNGTPGYTYSWNTGQTTSTVNNVGAGTLTVTVKDANNCSVVANVTVPNSGAVITPTITPINEKCNGGNTGSATVAGVTGGTTPYTYSWSNGQTTTNATGLVAAGYTVTVTDNNGCVGTASVNITQPTALAPAVAPTAAVCNGGNGSITTTGTTGGTPGYTYLWSNGATTSSITTTAGPYTVTVTDANGCAATANTTINQPAAMTITSTFVAPTCGATNGSATVTSVIGGTPAYGYTWNTGQTTSTISPIPAGSYTVTIKDAHGCTNPVTIIVPNSGGPRDSIVSQVNVLCFGGSTGSITNGTNRGTPPYTYLWSSGQTTTSLTNIPAGTYSVTVTDASGCTATASTTITQPAQLRDSITATVNEKCFGDKLGSITVGDVGGTTPYNYSWNSVPVQTTPTASGLPAGSYTVTLTDANGCTTTANGTITQPTQLTIKAVAFPVSCFGGCNGQLITIPSGGTTTYSYSWSNGSTVPSMTNICAGTYSVVITDANGCTVDSTGLIVTQPTAITGAPTTTTAHCLQADGGACITAGGGTPGYKYSWNTGATASCITNSLPANYQVVITDANKCTDTVKIIIPNAPGDTALITAITNVTCNGGNDGSITGAGKGGTTPYTYLWTPTGQTTPTATNLIAGNYKLTLTDATGCTDTISATVTQPALVVATPSAPQTICIGQSATLSATAIGGTPPYTFTWMPGGLTGSPVVVSPTVTTTYSITTVDSKLCPGAQVTIVVTVNPPLKITVSPNRAVCPGGSMSFTATATGGDGTYNYMWNPGGLTTQTITVTPGTTTEYTVTVTDGCTTPLVKDSVKATIDPLPVVSFKADTLQGCSPLCVNFTDLTTITTAGLSSWAWTFGDGNTSNIENANHCYMNAGVYSVGLVVTSDSGCVDSQSINNYITVFSHPVAAYTWAPHPVIIVEPIVNFTDESTDAYGLKSWLWQFGDPKDGVSIKQNPTYTYSDTGTFCPLLTVTNIHGCTDSVQHCVIVEPFFTLYIPNAFTPNGDGVNDIFTAKGTYVCTFQMYIYDRWGMQLYYSEDMNKGWDGTVNGGSNMCQEDTYIYLITATDCVEHKKHQYLGRVSIIK